MAAVPAIGVFLPTMTERGAVLPDVAAAARHAEHLGLESAWAIDQLVGGTGVPLLDSTVALAAASAVTDRLRLGFGVLIVPLRPVVWIAKQVASLQHVSGNRVLLGVGVGGDRHAKSWAAAGVPRSERGRRTDAALAVLPDLIAGHPTVIGHDTVQLAPGADVPPIIVGGTAPASLERTAAHGDGWFAMPAPDDRLAATAARLAELATARGRPAPRTTASLMVALAGDPTRPDRAALTRRLTDPDGLFGAPAEAVDTIIGDVGSLAERFHALGAAGVERVVVTVAGGDWFRQAELVAQAQAAL